MAKYKIRYGLGGGFGGPGEWEVYDFETEEAAIDEAYRLAVETYESYEGMHGLRDVTEIMEDEDCDEDEAYGIRQDEMDSWLDYEAVLVKE